MFKELELNGLKALDLDNVKQENRMILRTAQLRFKGQMHSVNVNMPEGPIDAKLLEELGRRFIETYERLFGAGTSSASAGIEMVTLRVYAIGVTTVPQLDQSPLGQEEVAPSGSRKVWYRGSLIDVPTYSGPLQPGNKVHGPALLDYPGQTTWVPINTFVEVDQYQSLVITVN